MGQDVDDALCQRLGGDGGQEAGAGVAQDRGVVAEIGGHDRPARGEVDGDLALDRVVLAARQAGVDQNVGAAGQRDDLRGGLTRQHDQPIRVRPERGTVALGGLGGAPHEHATRFGQGAEDVRQGIDQDRHPLVRVDDAADIHDHLVLGPDPRDRRRRRRAGLVVLREVDPRVDDRDPLGRHSLLLDHDPLDRLAQDNDLRRVPQDPALDGRVKAIREPPPQAVALDLVAQERVDLVDQGPAVTPAGEVRPRRPTVVLRVDQVERRLAGDPPQAADPAVRGQRPRRRPLEVAQDWPSPRPPRLEVRQHHLHPALLERPDDLDRQHRRPVILARDRKRCDHQDAHQRVSLLESCDPSIVAPAATRKPQSASSDRSVRRLGPVRGGGAGSG